jgi:hypothetical protein
VAAHHRVPFVHAAAERRSRGDASPISRTLRSAAHQGGVCSDGVPGAADGQGNQIKLIIAGGGPDRERVGLPCHGGQSGSDALEVSFDVRRGGGSDGVGVPGVGAGDPVPEMAFDPGQGRVPEPVGGDALGGDPRRSFADAFPQVVVAAAGQTTPVAIPQKWVGGQDGARGSGHVHRGARRGRG